MVERLLHEYKPEDLWIFAYGSLIWNSEFEFVETLSATAYGWHHLRVTLAPQEAMRSYPASVYWPISAGCCLVAKGCNRP